MKEEIEKNYQSFKLVGIGNTVRVLTEVLNDLLAPHRERGRPFTYRDARAS